MVLVWSYLDRYYLNDLSLATHDKNQETNMTKHNLFQENQSNKNEFSPIKALFTDDFEWDPLFLQLIDEGINIFGWESPVLFYQIKLVVKYCTRTITTRSWFETALDYKPWIWRLNIFKNPCLYTT